MFPRPAHRAVPRPLPTAGRPSLVKAAASAALLALAAMTARAGGTLELPVADADGQRIDVGVLVLGHSTSAAGDWPGASLVRSTAIEKRRATSASPGL